MPFPSSNRPPSLWVLGAPGTGDNRQLAALAGAIGGSVRWFDAFDPVSAVIGDRLVEALGRRRLRPSQAERFQPPWPDLVLVAGGRSVVDARRIRRASGNTSRIVCVGRPWAPLAWFDLVVTTPQYGLPAAPNVLEIPLPLNVPERPDPEILETFGSRFADRPRPWFGVLLGGDSGSYRFTAAAAGHIGNRINELHSRAGGSVFVAGSPRTPGAAMAKLRERITAPSEFFGWHDDIDDAELKPYPSLLALCDGLLVTGDSASMMAEACFSGRPVAILDLPERARARQVRKLGQLMPAAMRTRLARNGLWVPARDLSRLHERALREGWLVDLAAMPNALEKAGKVSAVRAAESVPARRAHDPGSKVQDELLERVRGRVFDLLG